MNEARNIADGNTPNPEAMVALKEMARIVLDSLADFSHEEQRCLSALFDAILNDRDLSATAHELRVSVETLNAYWHKFVTKKQFRGMPSSIGVMQDYVHGRLNLEKQDRDLLSIIKKLDEVCAVLLKKTDRTQEETDELAIVKIFLDSQTSGSANVAHLFLKGRKPTGTHREIIDRIKNKYSIALPHYDGRWLGAVRSWKYHNETED